MIERIDISTFGTFVIVQRLFRNGLQESIRVRGAIETEMLRYLIRIHLTRVQFILR